MLCPLKLAPATVPRAFLIWKAMHSAVAKILQISVPTHAHDRAETWYQVVHTTGVCWLYSKSQSSSLHPDSCMCIYCANYWPINPQPPVSAEHNAVHKFRYCSLYQMWPVWQVVASYPGFPHTYRRPLRNMESLDTRLAGRSYKPRVMVILT